MSFEFKVASLDCERKKLDSGISNDFYKRDLRAAAISLKTLGLVRSLHENLTTLWASSSDAPIDDITWLGVYEEEVQAEPVDISACGFNVKITASASRSEKAIDNVLGRVLSSVVP